jgi:phosphatidylserine decarboxylase
MIATYGLKFIAAGAVITIVLILIATMRDSSFIFAVAVLFALLTLFLTWFYRNPTRQIPPDDNLILSIADGRVLSVEEVDNEYIGGRGRKVSIFMSVLDAHINRIPIDGKLDYVKYTPGKFFKAFVDKASEENEHTELGLSFGENKMIFKQIAGILARRIVCDPKPEQTVHKGEIFGMIHFGSRAELFLPENVEVVVKKGDHVKAGETIIGRIIKK